MSEYIVGIDPGNSGAIAVLDIKSGDLNNIFYLNNTFHDVAEFLYPIRKKIKLAVLEKIYFRLGDERRRGINILLDSHSTLKGILIAYSISFEHPIPATWQKKILGKTNGGDKKIDKQKAQQLFSNIADITDRNADALLLAHYGRLILNEWGIKNVKY